MSKQDKKELRQQIACEWLEENYLNYGSLRHDVVTDRLQIRMPNLESLENASLQNAPEGLQFRGKDTWRNLTDKDINTMVCQCVSERGVNISTNEMWTALKSDMVPAVHPLRAWLDGLRPYTADQPDWIDFVASQVRVMHGVESCRMVQSGVELGGSEWCRMVQNGVESSSAEKTTLPNTTQPLHNATQDLWRGCFKKWFVAMVASWMKDEVVNHQVLVLIGKQGIFKTTWLEHLIPPHLRAYACKLANSNDLNKDERLRIAEFGLISLDEIDSMNNRELNQLKSIITSSDVNERAAYAYTKERRVRLASFCASGNRRDFLTDITGNRRWLPFEVESIQNPFYTIMPYKQMYAQAWALAQDPSFNYWFELDEIDVLEQHNQQFRDESNEEQLLPILFDIPAEGRGEFMTTAQISERLVTYGNIKKPMAIGRLGVLLGQKGYRSVTRGSKQSRIRGWIVYQRDSDEINTLRRLLKDDTSQHDTAIY